MWVLHQRNCTGMCHWHGLIMILNLFCQGCGSPTTEHQHMYCRQWPMWYSWNILEVFLQLSVPTVASDEHTVHIINSCLWIYVCTSPWVARLFPTVVEVMLLHSISACEHMLSRACLLLDNLCLLLKAKDIITGRLWRNYVFPWLKFIPMTVFWP